VWLKQRSKWRQLAYAIFNVKNTAILNITWGNLGDLTKRRHLSAHFGQNIYITTASIEIVFIVKIFPKIHTLGQLKKYPANFE